MTSSIQTLADQFKMVDTAFEDARYHPKPIGVSGLAYLRRHNRWWETATTGAVAEFFDALSAGDTPQELAALIIHTKDRIKMSVMSDTNSVLVRIAIQFQTRTKADKDRQEIIQDRFLVEFQWQVLVPSDTVGMVLGAETDNPLAPDPDETPL